VLEVTSSFSFLLAGRAGPRRRSCRLSSFFLCGLSSGLIQYGHIFPFPPHAEGHGRRESTVLVPSFSTHLPPHDTVASTVNALPFSFSSCYVGTVCARSASPFSCSFPTPHTSRHCEDRRRGRCLLSFPFFFSFFSSWPVQPVEINVELFVIFFFPFSSISARTPRTRLKQKPAVVSPSVPFA